ncbi:MAG TPA: helix-turn-helix domain-containing protein [Solirubrobacteraceae bacterium]|nr:helix-turn-helix domain-containing protein [Solirubrobacteraceae bacterium]
MEQIGRREANRRATREAVLEAARALFASKGYDATSMREIAEASGVPERTLYRHFDGKESLLDDELQRWLDAVAGAIRARPDGEPPLTAIEHTVVALAEAVAADPAGRPAWMFTDAPRPFEMVANLARRPMQRFEEAITDALVDRGTGPEAPLVARVAVAVIRSAAISRRADGVVEVGNFAPYAREAFAQLRTVTRAEWPP